MSSALMCVPVFNEGPSTSARFSCIGAVSVETKSPPKVPPGYLTLIVSEMSPKQFAASAITAPLTSA